MLEKIIKQTRNFKDSNACKALIFIFKIIIFIIIAIIAIKISYEVSPEPYKLYYTLALAVSILTGLGLAYEIINRKSEQRKTKETVDSVIDKLDIIAYPHTIKPDLKLFFDDSKNDLTQITLNPIFIDLEMIKAQAKEKYPKIDTSNRYSGLFGDPNKVIEYKREKEIYDATIKSMCKIKLKLVNDGDAIAKDISIFLSLPDGISALEEIPYPPEEPSRLNTYSMQNFKPRPFFKEPIEGPLINEDKQNEIRYNIDKINNKFEIELPEVVIVPVNKETNHTIKYDIAAENIKKKTGKLKLRVVPKKQVDNTI